MRADSKAYWDQSLPYIPSRWPSEAMTRHSEHIPRSIQKSLMRRRLVKMVADAK